MTATAEAIISLEWSTFTNESLGYSFEYPSWYDLPERKSCAPYAEGGGSRVWVGVRTSIDTMDATDITIEDFLNQTFNNEAISILSQETEIIGGKEAVFVLYQYGGANRSAELRLIKIESTLYLIHTTWGWGCHGIDGYNYTSLYLYYHILESLQFPE